MTAPFVTPETEQQSVTKPETPDTFRKPNLLQVKETEAAKRLFEEWDNSYPTVKPWIEQWRVNVAHSEGYSGVRLLKQQDTAVAYFPLNSAPNVNAMNEAQRLRERLRAVLFADPPAPEATPASDDSEDTDAAEVATKGLIWECDEGRLSYGKACGDAFDIGSDYGSGFIHFYVDPHGGGWQPQEIQASAQAQTVQDATHDPVSGEPWDGDFTTRYVKNDGTLTDDRADPDVAMQWLPAVKRELLTGKQVRFIPSTAEDLWDADGVQIASLVPLGQLKGMFPDLMKMDDAGLAKLVSARPQNVKDLLPKGRKDLAGTMTDDTLVFVVTRYQRQSAGYPKGAYLIAAGGEMLLHRQEWWDAQHNDALDIALTQIAQLYKEGNPYYVGIMERLGPGNELLAYCYGAVLEHLDRLSARKTYLPFNSNLTPEQMQSPTATVLYTVPGTEPHYEELPDLPDAIEKTIISVREQMKDEANLQDPIGGQNPPSVQSDVHARTIIEQVNQTLSSLKQNAERGIARGYRIIAQLQRAFYTVPQQVRSLGEDGAYKLWSFSGTDLGNTRDIKINKASFTGLTPSAKAALAQSLFMLRDPQGQGVFSVEDLKHVVGGNIGGMLGVQDNPHLQAIRRQIVRWEQGPPEGWAPPPPTIDPQTQQPVPGPDPVAAQLWFRLPVHLEPTVAHTRAYELGNAMERQKFKRWPMEWQQGLVNEYKAMAQAAQIATIPQLQQQIQQLQQGMQQQQQAAQDAQMQTHVEAAQNSADQVQAAAGALLEQNKQGIDALAQQQEAHKAEIVGLIGTAAEHIANASPRGNGSGHSVTVVSPTSKELETGFADLGQRINDSEAALQSMLADFAQLKHLAMNTAVTVAKKPAKAVGVAIEPKKGKKPRRVVVQHDDGSQSSATVHPGDGTTPTRIVRD